MLVYTVGMTGSGRAWFEGNLRVVAAEARHYESAHDFEAALDGEKPGMVVVADPPCSETEMRRILDASEETKGIPVFRAAASASRSTHDGDGPNGSAQAVMTGFDAMPPIDDADPWRKRPV